MNNLRFYFVLFSITLFFTIQSYSQSYHAEFVGNETPCPGVTEHYTLVAYYKDQYGNKEGQIINNTTIWGRVGGVLVAGGWDGATFIDVKWNDVKSGKLTVYVEMTKIEPGQYITVLATLNAKPMSITNVDPSVISGDNAINYGDTSNKTYSINPILYPDSSATYIYKWTIPSGWIHSGTISNGTNLYTTSSPSIVITPNVGCNGNEIISVYGVNDQCSGNPNSNPKQLLITRTWPSCIISGSNLICTSGSYFVNNLPSNYSILWSSSSKLNRTTDQGINPASFSKIGSSGEGQITAVLSINGCTGLSKTIVKDCWIGNPTPEEILYYNIGPYYPGYNQICLDNGNDGKLIYQNNLAGVTGYEWDALDWSVIQHPNDPYPDIDMQDVQILAPPYGYSVGDPVYITVRARNTCSGWGDWKYPKLELEAVNCGYFMMTMSPNPADTYVELLFAETKVTTEDLTNSNEPNSKSIFNKDKSAKDGGLGNYLVQILDGSGKVRKSSNVIDKKIRFETKDLEAGTYYVHIMDGDKVYKQQLIIN